MYESVLRVLALGIGGGGEGSVYPHPIMQHLALCLRDLCVCVTSVAVHSPLLIPWEGLQEGLSLHDLTYILTIILL